MLARYEFEELLDDLRSNTESAANDMATPEESIEFSDIANEKRDALLSAFDSQDACIAELAEKRDLWYHTAMELMRRGRFATEDVVGIQEQLVSWRDWGDNGMLTYAELKGIFARAMQSKKQTIGGAMGPPDFYDLLKLAEEKFDAQVVLAQDLTDELEATHDRINWLETELDEAHYRIGELNVELEQAHYPDA